MPRHVRKGDLVQVITGDDKGRQGTILRVIPKRDLVIVQGINDPRVPASESEQMVAAIRANGGEVWYLAAKDEGHGFRKKANRDFYLKTLAMFLRRLAGNPQAR